MSEKKESENEREIIQVRRIVPKQKTEDKSKEDELKAKTMELKRRVFRMQLALGVGLAFFIFLGLRSLGCFPQTTSPRQKRADGDVKPSDDAPPKNAAAPFSLDAPFPSTNSNDVPRSHSGSDSKFFEPSEMKMPPNGAERLRVLRIATWNLGDFSFAKLSNFETGSKIAKLIQEFDVVSLQGIRVKNRAVLDGLSYLIAQNGANYSFVASTPGRRDKILAIFFNADAVVVDRSTVSEIADSRGRLDIPSLVASFRTESGNAQNSFTFQIIDCDLPKNAESNGPALVDVYRTIRNRAGALGVAEDDLLLAGDFGLTIRKIKNLETVPNFVAIHLDKKTDVDGGSNANILFDSVATTEYVERFGVVDLADYFEISDEQAAKIAQGRPLWADFSVFEGGDAQFSNPLPLSETQQLNPKLLFGGADSFP